MTELFLIRHGETEWSRSGRHTSVTDLPLTEHGEQQARSLCGRLDPAAFELILTSPRIRARRTAELAGFNGRFAARVDDDLVEWAYGDFEGLDGDQIHQRAPGWTVWTQPTPGGETAEQVRTRLARVVDRVTSSGVERAVCFGHGHALRALAMCWLDLAVELGQHFSLETATVSVLGYDRGTPSMERWNAPPGDLLEDSPGHR